MWGTPFSAPHVARFGKAIQLRLKQVHADVHHVAAGSPVNVTKKRGNVEAFSKRIIIEIRDATVVFFLACVFY